MSGPGAHALFQTPEWLPLTLDANAGAALFVPLDERAYHSASFLDERILTPETRRQWIGMREVAAHLPGHARQDAHYILHIGHVGSTLIARLLGERRDIFSVREPAVLRGLADLHRMAGEPEAPQSPVTVDHWFRLFRPLHARTFRPEQQALVKVTSFASEIAPRLCAPDAKRLLLWVDAETYLRTILAGEGSRGESAALAGARLRRLHHRLGGAGWKLWEMSEGQRIAMSWASEMLSLADAADHGLWLSFDAFLAAPAQSLVRIGAHLGRPIPPPEAAALVAGPLMQRYSKAPEHGYSADLRRQLLMQAGTAHGAAIRAGLAWLEGAAAQHPRIADALARPAGG